MKISPENNQEFGCFFYFKKNQNKIDWNEKKNDLNEDGRFGCSKWIPCGLAFKRDVNPNRYTKASRVHQ